MSEVSIIIPTLNREKLLQILLRSILSNSSLPMEVIVVDSSKLNKTKNLVDDMHDIFSKHGIALRYVWAGQEDRRSISFSRNLGASISKGKILMFLDDDVVLDKDYIAEILKIFAENQNAVGVQGYMVNSRLFAIGASRSFFNALAKVFSLYHVENNKCVLLRSGRSVYPYSLTGTLKCQWLSSANCSYKQEVFEHFIFDEKLKKFSVGEDLDLSHRISTLYPDSLYITEHARVIHRSFSQESFDPQNLIYMGTAYITYLFFKNVNQTFFNRVVFVWSMLGQFIITLLFDSKGTPRFHVLSSLIKAYVYTLRNLYEVRSGVFSFLR